MNLTDKHTTVFIIRTAAVIIKPVLCSFQGSYSQYAFNTLILFDFSVYSCRRVMIYNATIQCWNPLNISSLCHLREVFLATVTSGLLNMDLNLHL